MVRKIIFGIAIVIWLVVIFSFSAADSGESTKESKSFTTNVVNVTTELADKLNIIEEKPSDSEIADIVTRVNPVIRKFAHATVYLVLAFLILFALDTRCENFWRNAFVAVIICFLYAITDEYHQTFVPGRSGEFRDCLIDALGATMACCLYGIGTYIFFRKKTFKIT